MLKFVVFFACFATLHLNVECIPEEFKEIAAMLRSTCLSQTGASEGAVVAAGTGNFADDPALKCYMKCIGVELATMDDDGTLDEDALLALAPPDLKALMEPVVRKCGTKVGSDPCDTAFLTNKCWYDGAPDQYMLI